MEFTVVVRSLEFPKSLHIVSANLISLEHITQSELAQKNINLKT